MGFSIRTGGSFWLASGLAVASLGLGGCSKELGSLLGTKPNIVGQISLGGGGGQAKPSGRTQRIFGGKVQRQVRAQSVDGDLGGCTVTVAELSTGASVLSTTSEDDGTWVVESDSLVAGTPYRVSTDCPPSASYPSGFSLAAVSTPTLDDPDEKTPETIDPLTTMIAAAVLQAVMSAVEEATSAVSGNAAAVEAIKNAVLSAVATLVAQIVAIIEEAVENGAMEVPDLGTASDMADAFEEAEDSTGAGAAMTAYETAGFEIPESVTAAQSSAAGSVSALPACDTSLNEAAPGTATEASCGVAISRILYSLGFELAINVGPSGLFADYECSEASLGELFPSARFEDLSNQVQGPSIPEGCFIALSRQRADRNQRPDDHGKGENGGNVFTENFPAGGGFPGINGVVTALAQSMIAGRRYLLEDIDRMMFSRDGAAGLNMRPILQAEEYNGEGYSKLAYYWDETAQQWAAMGCEDLHPSQCPVAVLGQVGFVSAEWSSPNAVSLGSELAGAVQAVAEAIGLGNFVGRIFPSLYSGPIPSMAQLADFVNERTFIPYNPSGDAEIYALTTQLPRWVNPSDNIAGHSVAACSDGDPETPCEVNGCYDGDPQTACYGADNQPLQATRVNVTFGEPLSDGRRPIASIAGDQEDGKFLLQPVSTSSGGFTGVLRLINQETGREMRDDHNSTVAIFVKHSGNSFPDGLSGSDDQVFNVDANWSCSGDGQSCELELGAIAGATAAITASGVSAEMVTRYTDRWEPMWVLSGEEYVEWGAPLLTLGTGQGGWWNSRLLALVVDPSTGLISGAEAISGYWELQEGKYGVSPRYQCTEGAGCSVAGFFLINHLGTPLQDAGASSKWTAGDICGLNSGSGQVDCALENVVKLTATDFASYSGIDFDPEADGAQSFAQAVSQAQISSGSVPNPAYRCSQSPFFVDGPDGNGELDCDSSDAFALGGDRAFNSFEQFEHWLGSDPSAASSGGYLQQRENGYRFGNPGAVQSLIASAFGSMLDGEHSLDESTRLSALQAFALIYVHMESTGSGGADLPWLLPEGLWGKFEYNSPVMMREGADPVIEVNNALNAAFSEFAQE